MAAFQSLGGFIATFADPLQTGLRLTDDGTVVYSEDIVSSCLRERCVGLVLR